MCDEVETSRDLPGVTQLLRRVSAGENQAATELIQLVYTELRGIALRLMERERGGSHSSSHGSCPRSVDSTVGRSSPRRMGEPTALLWRRRDRDASRADRSRAGTKTTEARW